MANISSLEKYQRYLEQNYDNGHDRYFSPTGFLKQFQRKVDLEVQKNRDVIRVARVDDAVRQLEPAIAGCDGVFDIAAEPGSGKTSSFPFKFPSKRVVVVEPSPFDAWSAYNMATGPCMLKLKGLSLGPKDANVVYTDSYMGAAMVLEDSETFDIMMVDECDSDRGVTKFLSEIKVKGKLLIRMSATIGDFGAIKTSSYRVEESTNMPDVRRGVKPLADYVKRNSMKRNLVLAPDAVTAKELAGLIPGSVTVTTASRLQDLADTMIDQLGPGTFVADDLCSRGLNLNIDALFDCQIISEKTGSRNVTPSEAAQRVGRVGRNKPGWYHCPGITPVERIPSLVDIMRHNVVRVAAGVAQDGPPAARLLDDTARQLVCSSVEPYEVVNAKLDDVVVPISPTSDFEELFYEPTEGSIVTRTGKTMVEVPSWFHTIASPGKKYEKSYTVFQRDGGGATGFARKSRRGSKTESTKSSSSGGSSSAAVTYGSSRVLATHLKPMSQVAESAPFAVDRARPGTRTVAPDLPAAPPVMDLTKLTYDMDWPALLSSRVQEGADLPTIVPPKDWRHTAATGMGSDWFARLDHISTITPSFDDKELEVVCRAWNKLATIIWIMKTPGLPGISEENGQRLEFCLRYFIGVFNLSSS